MGTFRSVGALARAVGPVVSCTGLLTSIFVSKMSIHFHTFLSSLVCHSIHSDEGLKLETSVLESFAVTNLPY